MASADLLALIEWWRTTRHPRIAEIAIAMARELGADRPAIYASSKRADHEAWLALARAGDPLDMPRLLAALTHTNTVQGLERLRALGDDPHLVPGMFALMREPPSKSRGGMPLWGYVMYRLVELRDIRARHEIARLLPDLGRVMDSTVGDWLRVQLENTLPRLPTTEPALTASDRARLETFTRPFPEPVVERDPSVRSAADLDELLREIHADLDDDGPRMVYADAIGGELGAFINAQLRGGEAIPPNALREQLMAPLAGLVRDATFVRGFLDTVTIWKRRSAIRAHVGLPIWRTVRTIEIYDEASEYALQMWPRATIRDATELLCHPVMSNLRTVDNVIAGALPGLGAMPSRDELSALTVRVTRDTPAASASALASFPALRRLTLHVWDVEPATMAWRPPFAVLDRLDHLVVRGSRAWFDAVGAGARTNVTHESARGRRWHFTA